MNPITLSPKPCMFNVRLTATQKDFLAETSHITGHILLQSARQSDALTKNLLAAAQAGADQPHAVDKARMNAMSALHSEYDGYMFLESFFRFKESFVMESMQESLQSSFADYMLEDMTETLQRGDAILYRDNAHDHAFDSITRKLAYSSTRRHVTERLCTQSLADIEKTGEFNLGYGDMMAFCAHLLHRRMTRNRHQALLRLESHHTALQLSGPILDHPLMADFVHNSDYISHHVIPEASTAPRHDDRKLWDNLPGTAYCIIH